MGTKVAHAPESECAWTGAKSPVPSQSHWHSRDGRVD